MFSKRTLMIVGLIVIIAINVIVLSLSSRRQIPAHALGRFSFYLTAPFQNAVTASIRFSRDIWRHYFLLVAVSKENDSLRGLLEEAIERNHDYTETERANHRLRNMLNFQKTMGRHVLAAEVIGQNPSPWYKTVVIDKGLRDGVRQGMPVVVPRGIVGQVMTAGRRYSKVLLVVDQNNAVDALVERSRARGILTGSPTGLCNFKYVLRKDDVKIGDPLISSGLDGVFPKGLRVGYVSGVLRKSSGIFQEVTVTPFVDFEKLEELLVVLTEDAPLTGKDGTP